MRHFGHGVGHLQYERQHEAEPDTMMGLEGLSDSSDKNDTEDEIVQNGHDNFAVESEEESESYNGEIVDDESDEGEWSDNDAADTISDSGGSNSDGYPCY